MSRTSALLAVTLLVPMLVGLFVSACDTARAEQQARPQAPNTGGTASAASPQQPAPSSPTRPVVPASPTPSGARVVRISGTGDVLIHQRVAEAARLHANEGAFDWSLHGLAAAIDARDVAFANLETPLTTEFRDPQSVQPPVLGAPAEVAAALSRAGVDVVGLANNHAYDQTARGLVQSIERARAAGLVAVGAAHDEADAYAPTFIERDGVRIAFLSATDRLNSSPERWDDSVRVARVQNEALLAPAIARARREADVVVLALHWGEEWALAVTRQQRALAQHLVELGVDLILGTGPHVLQSVDRMPSARGEAIVAYSLGNSISNQGLKYMPGHLPPGLEGLHEESPLPRDSVLLRVTFEVPERGRLAVRGVEGVPLWTDNNWRRRTRDHTEIVRVMRLADCDELTRTERRPEIARTLGAHVELVQ